MVKTQEEIQMIPPRKVVRYDELGVCELCLLASICVEPCEEFLEAHGELDRERGYDYYEG